MPHAQKKKINPRRRPVTQADLDKAKKWARDEAIETIGVITMFTLRDVFGFGEKRLRRFWNAFLSLCEDVASGQVPIEDIKGALKDEYNIDVTKDR